VGRHEDMETESLGARVRDAYERGPDAVTELVATPLSARVQALEEEKVALRATLGTSSHNSGKPPSSDGPEVKPHPQSQRRATGRRPGGQQGHTGHSVQLTDTPNAVQAQLRPRAVGAAGRVWQTCRCGVRSDGR